MGGWWVGGSLVVGGGSCLFEDNKGYIFSSLSARSKIVLGLVCFENFQSLIKKRVRVRVRLGLGTHDPPTHAD